MQGKRFWIRVQNETILYSLWKAWHFYESCEKICTEIGIPQDRCSFRWLKSRVSFSQLISVLISFFSFVSNKVCVWNLLVIWTIWLVITLYVHMCWDMRNNGIVQIALFSILHDIVFKQHEKMILIFWFTVWLRVYMQSSYFFVL